MGLEPGLSYRMIWRQEPRNESGTKEPRNQMRSTRRAVGVTKMSTTRNELESNPSGWNPGVSVRGLWGGHEWTDT